MNRLKKIGRTFAVFLNVFLIYSACWIAVYLATSWGFSRLDRQLPEIFVMLIISLLGFMCFIVLFAILAHNSRKKDYHFHQEITNALGRISRGDFFIHIKKTEGPYRQLAGDINKMASSLKEMEDMRQAFISNVSHEIQSPLTSINGFARAMIDEELHRKEQLQYLEIIDSESKRLSKLSDDLLRLASLDSEHHPFHTEVYRLDKQIQTQILTFEPQWLHKELDIQVDLEAVTIEADKLLLSQVWVNLIHNAIKFTPEGGELRVSLKQQEEQPIVCFTDTGIGITTEDQIRIFERFFKADRARSRTAEGSGLGLSIVNKIVKMHRGKVNVRSKQGEGTQFTVVLPKVQKNI